MDLLMYIIKYDIDQLKYMTQEYIASILEMVRKFGSVMINNDS